MGTHVSQAPDRRVDEAVETKSRRSEAVTWCLLTPKFGKESDLWVQLGQESVSWKGRIFQMYSAKKSAVGYLLPFGKRTVELILRD
jgi:hypothetical protein